MNRPYRVVIWATLPLSMACASMPHAVGGDARTAPTLANGAQAETLPRFLTLELSKDDGLKLDGRAVALSQLQHEIKEAWDAGQFAEVLLWAEAGAKDATVRTLTDILLRAGVSHWRFAWRGATVALVPQPAATVAALPEPPGNSAANLQALTVKTIGLHIGGGPNDDATRKPLLALFERQLPAFADCAKQLPQAIDKPTSFGLDLLIGVKGGHPQPSTVRTRLRSQAFEQCMTEIFAQMDFPAPTKRPLMLSYSVTFNPISAAQGQ